MRLREPSDVLAAIPYLIGFHPNNSVVTLALRGNQMVFCARGDLPDSENAPGEIRDAVDHLVAVISKQRASAAILVAYGPADRAKSVLVALQAALEPRGVEVREMLRVEGGRFWSLFCESPTCCPPDGSRYDTTSSEVAATATLLGLATLPDRESFEKQLAPVGGISRISMGQATDRAHERLVGVLDGGVADDREVERGLREAGRMAVADAIDRTRQGHGLDDDEAAWLSLLVAFTPVWEATWQLLFGKREDLDVHRSLWLDVFRRAESDLRAAPGCLFAYAAWRTGDAAIATIALEHVLRIEPEHRLAREFGQAIRSGVSPSIMDSRRRSPRSWPSARRGRRRSSSGRAGNQ